MERRAFGVGAAIILAIGIAAAGFLIGRGFALSRNERFVTVRGLVERPVKANLAVWTLRFSATSNDVSAANAEIDRDSQTVADFARAHAFGAAEIQPLATRVTDMSAREYGGGEKYQFRYIVKGGVRIQSANVDRVDQVSQLTGELVKKGIVLSSDSEPGAASQNPAFFFTQLDSIRPTMLADATRSARLVAEQFAKDSGSRLGPIRRANQGVFEITGLYSQNTFDEPASIDKKVRLVTTVDYLLLN